MNFDFYPLGVPFSSSFAVTASVTLRSGNTFTTSSFAGFALLPVGPTGSAYKTVSGSIVSA